MSLLKVAGTTAASGTLYVDDVFSTYLYTGNGSTQTITNGIDLAGKGGLVWMKSRNWDYSHYLTDTARGVNSQLRTNMTSPVDTETDRVTAFNSSGFSMGANSQTNYLDRTYASWTFRKAAKFFDVVTYTGTGSARTIAHSLGVAPGMIIVKSTSDVGGWFTYHRSLGATKYLTLQTTSAETTSSTAWDNTEPTASVFTVGTSPNVNNSGATYVAYLFAHDTSSTGIIQCGSFTTPGQVNLGWEPQYLLYKKADGTSNWIVYDSMRGFGADTSNALYPNQSWVEGTGDTVSANATGFNSPYSGSTFIYMAIRMPNKPPTTGTQVFNPFVGSDASTITTGFPVDMLFDNKRAGNSNNTVNASRLVGEYSLITSSTAVETAGLVGANCFQNNTGYLPNALGTGIVSYAFKRAPGFFDVVCYTGTGVGNRTVAHNLAAIPEIMIVKGRGNTFGWAVYVQSLGNNDALYLNETSGSPGAPQWNTTNPTATQFTLGGGNVVNGSTLPYVAYLFATLAGISKVGSYTGNGTGQVIACGFSTGARFVLIKRTDSTGDWYTFDSARGLTSGSSPYLLLNSTAAETTGNNGVYASTGGFTLATSAAGLNASGGTYIFLAVA